MLFLKGSKRAKPGESQGKLETYPEQHPHGDAGVTERIPWDVSKGVRVDLGVGSVQLPEPEELEGLLRGEEGADEVRLRGEGARVGIVDVLHVGLGVHAVHLAEEVDPRPCQRLMEKDRPEVMKVGQSMWGIYARVGTHTKEAGATMRAVESDMPMLASGAVGGWYSTSGLELLGSVGEVLGRGKSGSSD